MKKLLLIITFLFAPNISLAKSSFIPQKKYWQNPSLLEVSRNPASFEVEITKNQELFKLKDRSGREYRFDTVEENCYRSPYDSKEYQLNCY